MPVHPRFPQCPLSFLLPAASIRRWAAAGVQAGRRPPRRGRRALTPAVPSAHCHGRKQGPSTGKPRPREPATKHGTLGVSPASPFPLLSTPSRPTAPTQPPTGPAGEPHLTVGVDEAGRQAAPRAGPEWQARRGRELPLPGVGPAAAAAPLRARAPDRSQMPQAGARTRSALADGLREAHAGQ